MYLHYSNYNWNVLWAQDTLKLIVKILKSPGCRKVSWRTSSKAKTTASLPKLRCGHCFGCALCRRTVEWKKKSGEPKKMVSVAINSTSNLNACFGCMARKKTIKSIKLISLRTLNWRSCFLFYLKLKLKLKWLIFLRLIISDYLVQISNPHDV